MKKVININFQGRVVPIEESSYDMLKHYTDSLRIYFAKEEGRDEIINDIESRIGELFTERLKNGATCITDDDVTAIINNMGRPEDFGDADDEPSTETGKTYSGGQYGPGFQPVTNNPNAKRLNRDDNNRVIGGVCSGIAAYFNIEPVIVRLIFIVLFAPAFVPYLVLWAFLPKSSNVINGVRKRLYRNPDDKIIAGICSGIASYFNINVWIPRTIFFIPFMSILFKWGFFHFPDFIGFTFSPGSLIVYIILWLTIPEASTTSEKLEMKGEKVDLNSIKNSVMEEMKEVQQRMEKLSKEARTVITEKGGAASAEMAHVARRSRSGIGNVIIFLAKAFAYFIVGCVALALVIFLFSVAIMAIGIFPILRAYILTDGWQVVCAWGTIILFVGVPVIAIITWIIRRIAKIKRGRSMMRYSAIALWIIGWFFAISLIASVSKDFKAHNNPAIEQVAIVNPGVKSLEVTAFPNSKYAHNLNFRFEPFADVDEDTMILNNVRYRLVKATGDSFEVTLVRMARGRSMRYADTLANSIRFNAQQVDSFLYVDRGVAITPQDKFRSQFVEVTIAVPVGARIKINNKIGRYGFGNFGPWDNWDNYDWDSEEHGWEYGEQYVMRADGLYTIDGDKADEDRNDRRRRRDPDINIRIETNDNDDNTDGEGENTPAGVEGYRFDQTEKKIDSLKMINNLQKERVRDSLLKVQEQIRKTLDKLEEKNTREEAHKVPELNNYSSLLDS